MYICPIYNNLQLLFIRIFNSMTSYTLGCINMKKKYFSFSEWIFFTNSKNVFLFVVCERRKVIALRFYSRTQHTQNSFPGGFSNLTGGIREKYLAHFSKTFSNVLFHSKRFLSILKLLQKTPLFCIRCRSIFFDREIFEQFMTRNRIYSCLRYKFALLCVNPYLQYLLHTFFRKIPYELLYSYLELNTNREIYIFL